MPDSGTSVFQRIFLPEAPSHVRGQSPAGTIPMPVGPRKRGQLSLNVAAGLGFAVQSTLIRKTAATRLAPTAPTAITPRARGESPPSFSTSSPVFRGFGSPWSSDAYHLPETADAASPAKSSHAPVWNLFSRTSCAWRMRRSSFLTTVFRSSSRGFLATFSCRSFRVADSGYPVRLSSRHVAARTPTTTPEKSVAVARSDSARNLCHLVFCVASPGRISVVSRRESVWVMGSFRREGVSLEVP